MPQRIKEIEELFKAHASDQVALWQHNYMKELFPFFGLSQPVREALKKQLPLAASFSSKEDLTCFVWELWQKPHREFHYYGMDLLRSSAFSKEPSMLEFYEKLVRTNSWWDSIDTIAAHLVGAVVQAHPHLVEEMDRWSEDDFFWIRRTALLHQLRYKLKTDKERLFSYCSKMSHEKEFFIRKAIGWALREYSKTDAFAVKEFLLKQPLSPLSYREAKKYL